MFSWFSRNDKYIVFVARTGFPNIECMCPMYSHAIRSLAPSSEGTVFSESFLYHPIKNQLIIILAEVQSASSSNACRDEDLTQFLKIILRWNVLYGPKICLLVADTTIIFMGHYYPE